MSFDIDFEELMDLSDDSDSPLPSPGALKATLREHGKQMGGKLPHTTASTLGSEAQTTTTNVAQLLMGVPIYKDARVSLMQNNELHSALIGTSAADDADKGIGGGFDLLIPSDIAADVDKIGALDLTGIGQVTSSDGSQGGSGAWTQVNPLGGYNPNTPVGTGVGYEERANESNTGEFETARKVSNAKSTADWGPQCLKGPYAEFKLYGDVKVSVHPGILDAVKYLDACMRAANYKARNGETWSICCRKVGARTCGTSLGSGGTNSLHSFGIALDINAPANPMQAPLKTDMPAKMVANIKSLRTKSGAIVWRWGGDYRKTKDAMHYEIVCSPAELASGLDHKSMKV